MEVSVLPKRRAWADLSLRTKGWIVLVLPMGAMLCAFVALFLIHRQQDMAALRVQRALLLRAEIGKLQGVCANAETGVHSYLLTRNEEFLEPFHAAKYLLPNMFSRLSVLGEDDPAQADRLRHVQTLAEGNLAWWTALVDKSADAAPGDAPETARQTMWVEGRTRTDALRQELGALDAVAERLQAERLASLSRIERWRPIVAAAGVAAGLLGTGLALWVLNHGIIRRVRHLREHAHRLGEGESSAALPPAGRDEIAALARSLDKMGGLISERGTALEENLLRLRQSQRLYRAFANNFPNGSVFLFDHDLRFLVADGRGLAEAGPARESVEGRTIWEVFPPETAAPLEPLYRAALRGVAETREMTYEDRLYLVQTLPIRDEGGQIYAGLTVTQDITERKQAEEALHLARDEAERANQAKSEFLSRMSHELRTPLNAILGFAQLLETDNPTARQGDAIGHILKGGRHLLGLINEVLDLARVEAGHISLSLEPVNACEVFQESLDLVRPLASQRDLRLDSHFGPASECWVIADRQRLKQILVNFLSNAVKFNQVGGLIRAVCQPADDSPGRVRFCVRDTGPGIAPADQTRLFSAFERLSADRVGIEGTGLGLALTRRLAEMMSGSISVQSSIGEGSIFCLELPRTQALELPPLTPPETEPLAGDSGQRHTVLYIEDNLPNIDLVKHILENRSNLRFISAIRGDLGLSLVRTQRPDLILLDLDLPDMHGREVLRCLRNDPSTQKTPVVVISADAMPRGIEQILAAGANAYLTKPLDVRDFLRVLDEQFEAAETSVPR